MKKSKLKTLATPVKKPKKTKPSKSAYYLAVKLMADMDDTEKF